MNKDTCVWIMWAARSGLSIYIDANTQNSMVVVRIRNPVPMHRGANSWGVCTQSIWSGREDESGTGMPVGPVHAATTLLLLRHLKTVYCRATKMPKNKHANPLATRVSNVTV